MDKLILLKDVVSLIKLPIGGFLARRRIDAFELWCCRRLLRVPWTAGTSNQSILKEISPGDFFGRNDAKAETPVLWPPHAKS